MNILQLSKFYPPIYGGIELVEKMFTRAHISLGDNVFIVAFKNQEKTFNPIGEFKENIHWIESDLEFKSALINWSFIFQFKKYILLNKIQKIYVHLPNPYMHEVVRWHRNFLEKNKIQVVAIYHSDIVNQKFLKIFYNKYFSLTSKVYSQIIVSSDKLWQSSEILMNMPLEKKRVIPFCSEGYLTYQERKKFSGRLVAIGRLVTYKGFEFLINAIKDSPYQLSIIGDGPLYKSLKEIAPSNITIHGKLSEKDKNKIITESDLLVVSSVNHSEAYGMLIVEAFESGLPVIASDLKTGVTFLVQDGITGKTFKTLDKESLLSGIRYFSDNAIEYNNISKNVRQFYDKELSFNCFMERVKNL